MNEDDLNREIETTTLLETFKHGLAEIGVEYELVLNTNISSEHAKSRFASSLPTADCISMFATTRPDGEQRLTAARHSVFPANADLNPKNARIISSEISSVPVLQDANTAKSYHVFADAVRTLLIENKQ
jgi:hypothetical protein